MDYHRFARILTTHEQTEVDFTSSLSHLLEVVNRLLTRVGGRRCVLKPSTGIPRAKSPRKVTQRGEPASTCSRPGEEEAGLTQPLVSSWARF